MKKTLALGSLVLSCCLAVVAQQGSNPNQTPQPSTPRTFPQDQTGQTPANPVTPSGPAAIPPDINASGQTSGDHASNPASTASNSQTTTVQGCLSQSRDGNFMLADNSGNSFQLRGDTTQLNSFIGKEVQVEGIAMMNSGANVGSMSSPTSSPSASTASSASPATQFSVSDVHKLADACATGSSTTK